MARRNSIDRLIFTLVVEMPIRITVLLIILPFRILFHVIQLLCEIVNMFGSACFVVIKSAWNLFFKSGHQLAWTRSEDDSVIYLRKLIPSDVKKRVFARDGGRCLLCRSAYDLHYDHDIPLSKGGSDTVNNIRILCATCNLRKGARIE